MPNMFIFFGKTKYEHTGTLTILVLFKFFSFSFFFYLNNTYNRKNQQDIWIFECKIRFLLFIYLVYFFYKIKLLSARLSMRVSWKFYRLPSYSLSNLGDNPHFTNFIKNSFSYPSTAKMVLSVIEFLNYPQYWWFAKILNNKSLCKIYNNVNR